ncbi:MAG: bifunctional oligoribonuclease/PAP phosphatase NrnA [Tissierellia bacterium]|nr:bifunctional oligoribonuclease/PAP phosphatase NrnA [Tissierellia bacterium]
MVNYSVDDIKEFENIIENSKNIAIISHMSPDGDNLGSLLAMYLALKKEGKKVIGLELDEIPKYLNFLPKIEELSNNENLNIDTLITVDCANTKLLGELGRKVFDNSKNIINIDHHKTNENYGDLNIVDSKISSTCELVTNMFIDLNISFDSEISTALFTGICTDTGRFLYNSTTQDTFKIASLLIENGADKNFIMERLFQSHDLLARKLSTQILSKSEFLYNNKVVISSITNDILDKYNLKITDLNDVINYYRDTNEVEISCFIKEKPEGGFKVSFRSKNHIDVSQIAESFGGGGHFSAAACQIDGDLNEVKEKLIKRLDNIEW